MVSFFMGKKEKKGLNRKSLGKLKKIVTMLTRVYKKEDKMFSGFKRQPQ